MKKLGFNKEMLNELLKIQNQTINSIEYAGGDINKAIGNFVLNIDNKII